MRKKPIVVVVICSVILFYAWINYTKNILNYLEIKYENEPVLIFSIDSRSGNSVYFIKQIQKFIKNNNLKVNLFTYIHNNKSSHPYGEITLLSKKKFNRFKLKENHYYLFNKNKKFVHSNRLYNHKDLIKLLAKEFKNIDLDSYDKYIKVGDNILNNDYFKFLGKYLTKEKIFFTFFEEICSGCSSGEKLLFLNDKYNESNVYDINYVTVSGYTQKDIDRIKFNNNLQLNILFANTGFEKYWRSINNETSGINPLLGLGIVIDKKGVIKFITKKWSNNKDWQKLFLSI